MVALDPEDAVFEKPAAGAVAQAAPDATFAADAPEHGASAETVIGVMDEDFDDVPGEHSDSRPAEDVVHQTGDVASVVEEEPAPDRDPASEQTSTYDHLWERTVVRSIEDAAVRAPRTADIRGCGGCGDALGCGPCGDALRGEHAVD